MNSVLDNSLVGLALLASAGYAVMKLGPRSLRQRVLKGLSRVFASAPAFLNLQRISGWLDAASAGKVQGACGGCDGCGSEQTPVQQTAAQKSAPSEVRVPVGKIGRRANTGEQGG
ncbi:MAG: DUF6587 family protein [Gammaproteobacteria bacterium]